MAHQAPIIVGTDLSDHSHRAIVEAARRAQRDNAPLVVVHVASEQGLAVVDATKVAEALAQHVQNKVQGNVECVLLAGSPHAELIKLADKRGAGLIVLGASGEGGVGPVLFGTTAENVVRYAHGPVLVVRESAPGSAVVVGTDFSEASDAPVRVGIEEAKKSGARLVLFHSLHEQKSRLDVFDRLGISAHEPESEHEARREAAQNKLAAILTGSGIEGQTVTVDEAPVEALESLAKEVQASLIVIGTHGRTGFKRMALGSVAASVVRGAECSVLVVR